MNKYLLETSLHNFSQNNIQELISTRNWMNLSDYEKIGSIYSFVKDEIAFGYNYSDYRSASDILDDKIGQCNTKATLLITLMRAVGIPARIHAFSLDHHVQKGVLSNLSYLLAPKLILHTWAEVLYQGEWIVLEGVILDSAYVSSFQNSCKSRGIDGTNFKGYAFGVNNLYALDVIWTGHSTYVQSSGIVSDLGVFDSSDDCFTSLSQNIGFIRSFIYSNITRHAMNKIVNKIRG